jgi:ribosome-associated translation inhibitor RaiA
MHDPSGMPVPLQLTFRGVDRSEALAAWIHEWAAKLEHVYDRIERAEVVVECPHRRRRQGKQFHVRIRLHVPGSDVVVDHDPGPDEAHEDPYVTVRDSFHAARRQLEDHARRLRGDVKEHDEPAHGRVVHLDVQGDWGRLETGDGRQIYFHRNSVLGGMEALALGTEVRFHEEPGEDGPQASTVEPLGQHGHHVLSPE